MFCPSLTSGLRLGIIPGYVPDRWKQGCAVVDESIHTHLASLALFSSSCHAQVTSPPSHCRDCEFVISRRQQKVYEATFDPDEAVRTTACLVERSGHHY